ncbi:MAG: hypothetical protein VB082_10910 [Christensenella sp.]|nr:hypothetical protein [Christensenella sp.]
MRAIRNLAIFLVLALVFVFVFAGNTQLDNILPLMEIKGAVTTAVIGGVYDLGDGEYLVKSKEKELFTEKMEKDGWTALPSEENGNLVFARGEERTEYRESHFLNFTVYRPAQEVSAWGFSLE